jgi:hypothetical protein
MCTATVRGSFMVSSTAHSHGSRFISRYVITDLDSCMALAEWIWRCFFSWFTAFEAVPAWRREVRRSIFRSGKGVTLRQADGWRKIVDTAQFEWQKVWMDGGRGKDVKKDGTQDARMSDAAQFGWQKDLAEKCFSRYVCGTVTSSDLTLVSGPSQTTLHISSIAIATNLEKMEDSWLLIVHRPSSSLPLLG